MSSSTFQFILLTGWYLHCLLRVLGRRVRSPASQLSAALLPSLSILPSAWASKGLHGQQLLIRITFGGLCIGCSCGMNGPLRFSGCRHESFRSEYWLAGPFLNEQEVEPQHLPNDLVLALLHGFERVQSNLDTACGTQCFAIR